MAEVESTVLTVQIYTFFIDVSIKTTNVCEFSATSQRFWNESGIKYLYLLLLKNNCDGIGETMVR